MKKVLCLFLVLVMLPCVVFAEDVPTKGHCSKSIVWEYSDGVLTISGTGQMSYYRWTGVNHGQAVEGYEEKEWKNFSEDIVKIVIADGITRIGAGAFTDCINVEIVEMADSVEEIYYEAFDGCAKLKEIKFSANLKSIGEYAFRDCSALENVVIPDSVNYIGKVAFADCTRLQKVVLGESMETVDVRVFAGCTSLEQVVFPDGIKSIHSTAFEETPFWENMEAIYTNDTLLMVNNSMKGAFTIKEGIKHIGDNAFGGCVGITSVSIPESVKTIGENAFWGCSALEKVNIPVNVKELSGTFSGCSTLEEIKLPRGIKSIGQNTFKNCAKIKKIDIPENVEYIGAGAFSGTAIETAYIRKAVLYGSDRWDRGVYENCHRDVQGV